MILATIQALLTVTGDDSDKVSSLKIDENHVQNGLGDGSDGRDDTSSTLTENHLIPDWITENRGWTQQEADDFVKEVTELGEMKDSHIADQEVIETNLCLFLYVFW